MKPKVLLVGDHPHNTSGNSNMIMELLNRIDYKEFDVTVYAGNRGIINNPFKNKIPVPVIEGGTHNVNFSNDNLVEYLNGTDTLDIIVFVGLDLWVCHDIFPQLIEAKRRLKFKWVSIFPYDVITIRPDWVEWLDPVDFPCVYSEYGYNLLKDHVKNIRYFRPPMHNAELFNPLTFEERQYLKQNVFPDLPDDAFIFGFFGNNQIRKDPQRLIKAFYEAKKKLPNIRLYLHTNVDGQYNLDQYLDDLGREVGDVYIKASKKYYDTNAMVTMYNIIDCMVTASLQEGLNWTILEAMLCGTPVIASDTTAHKELLANEAGLSVKSDVLTYTPLITKKGISLVETMAIDHVDMANKMVFIASEPKVREGYIERGIKRAKQWINNVGDINKLLKEASKKTAPIIVIKKDAVLFAQHSSAGDVLMTTRCFEDIRARHPNMPFDYMTSPQYMDIIEGNPYVDNVIPWNEKEFSKYKIIYNPHGEKILPGHWGRNSNSLLSDFYWKILLIDKPCDFYLGEKVPNEEIASKVSVERREIVLLHTTGGDPEFRTYKFMKDIADELWRKGYFTIQIGGKKDHTAGAMLDLRGKLSFKETTWVATHAMYAITVDSYIAHLCGALGISQICLFGSGNHNVVKPNQLKGNLICMVPDHIHVCPGLGPCSASVRNCPVKCTGVHSPIDILKNFERLERGLVE